MKQLLINNLEWFYNSGVMIPENGLWGVAERVALTKNNSALDKMLYSFPAWTIHENYCIIEQRRADCNFQAAFMYLLSYQVFGDKKYYDTAVNILDFLYFRSGLLWRSEDTYVPGSWNWSHIKRESVVWLDDESWCIFLALEIADKFPELEKKYEMKRFAKMLAPHMADGMLEAMAMGVEALETPDGFWKAEKFSGLANQPHWGSLACMALARTYKEEANPKYLEVLEKYHTYLKDYANKFDVSEVCYAIMGASAAYIYVKDEFYREVAEIFGQKLLNKVGANGNIPSEHNEAPLGEHLVDTIYTINWSLLGLSGLKAFNPTYSATFDKVLKLVCSIQDKSSEAYLKGCWRGMYDMSTNSWGGGNCYEGGADSIYTGWTNAPISIVIALELLNKNIF